jgi:hypothetical protein
VIADPEERERVREEMNSYFCFTQSLFVVYGSFTPHDPFDISWNAFRELCRDTGIIKRKNQKGGAKSAAAAADDNIETDPLFSSETVDMLFIQTNVEIGADAKKDDNDNRSLCRFELVEILIRVAIAKYGLKQKDGSYRRRPSECVELLFMRHLVPYAESSNKDHWRDDRMYNEDVCIILKSEEPKLVALFNLFVGRKRLTRMGVPELTACLKSKAVLGQGLDIRDAIKAFLLSRMMARDEMRPRMAKGQVPQEFHKSLSYVDFLECLCRLADMRHRGDVQGSLPWDVSKEGPVKALAEIVGKCYRLLH